MGDPTQMSERADESDRSPATGHTSIRYEARANTDSVSNSSARRNVVSRSTC